MTTTVLDRLRQYRALVLIRREAVADAVLDAFAEGGLQAVEVSLVAADAGATIARLRVRHPKMLVGAGTVRTVAQADAAVAAGPAIAPASSLFSATIRWAEGISAG